MPSWPPSRLIVLISLVHLGIPFSHILTGNEGINAYLSNDDTYYYLQTAWNARHLGFVTFDGMNATNGVQFLWFAILYALSWLTEDKSTFLQLASMLGIALTCVPYAVIGIISDGRWASPRSLMAVVMAVVWLVVCMYEPNQYLVGMESTLHAFIIWMIVLQYLKIYRGSRSGPVSGASVLFLVVLLVLNTWTRLDSAGLSASFLALLLYTLANAPVRQRLPTGVTILSAMVVLTGVVVLFSFFYLAGGSLVPVSAIVKGHQVDRFGLGAWYNWSLVLFPLRIPGANLLNILGIVALFASVWALVGMGTVAEAHGWADLRMAAFGLAAAVLIHSIVTFGMFRYYYFWYLSASFTYWTIVPAVLATELATRRAWSYRRAALSVAVLVVSLVSAFSAMRIPNNLAVTRYEVATWIDANLEKDAVLASFNAGQVGYFSNRSAVNLDGLINNAAYFDEVLRDRPPEALITYLDRIGVDYIVDYQLGRWREVVERRFKTVREFPLASGSAVEVMARIPEPR